MKKTILALSILSITFIGLTGCSSSSKNLMPPIKTTEKFRINSVSLNVTQRVVPEIQYHTESEIKTKVVEGIKKKLKEANLLSTDKKMTSLDIKMTYYRRFMGDATPFPSDSLVYPNYDYEIIVKDGQKVLRTISRTDQIYKGGFFGNLKVMSGVLRDKSDELPFIEALYQTIVEKIKALKN